MMMMMMNNNNEGILSGVAKKLPAAARRGAEEVVGSRTCFLAILMIAAALVPSCQGGPVITEEWRQPCGSESGASDSHLTELMTLLMTATQDSQSAVTAWKTALTDGTNARISEDTTQQLDNFGAHVGNFPHEDPATIDAQTNVSQYLIDQYVVKAKMYIFIKQSKLNMVCDTREDKQSVVDLIGTVLTRLGTALCMTERYLQVSGHPMPQELIPSKNAVLSASSPRMDKIPEDCDSPQSPRISADYLISRDAGKVLGQLFERYLELSS